MASYSPNVINIGNIRVNSNDVIKNWWKCSYFSTNDTKDSGEGDVDFYTYWYSLCYMVGMLNTYRYIFRDVADYEQMLYRFLTSREIAFKKSSSLDTLEYIYDNFVSELNKRGTKQITDYVGKSKEIGNNRYTDTGVILTDVAANAGMGIVNIGDLLGTLDTAIDLGLYHVIQFDVVFLNASGVQYAVGGGNDGGMFLGTHDGVYMYKLSTTQYVFTYVCNSVGYPFTVTINTAILNTVKFVRFGTKLVLYINGIYIESDTVTSNQTYNFTKLFSANLPAVANLIATKKDLANATLNVYSWACCEGSGFMLQSNKAPIYNAILDSDQITDWATIWRKSVLFDNTGYVGLDGEVKRVINYLDGESLLELIATSEMGFVWM